MRMVDDREPVDTPNYRAACSLVAEGFAVLPCRERGENIKAPYTTNGYKDATADAFSVVEWWTAHPNALPGIACGASGLLVVDLDGGNGLNNFLDACAKFGGAATLPDTFTVKTPHGLHLYFSVTQSELDALPATGTGWDFNKRKGSSGSNIDFRGRGGYVIAFGAVLPSGEGYVPQNATDPVRMQIRALPGWLYERLHKEDTPEVVEPPALPPALSADDALAASDMRVRDSILERLANAPQGARNATANDCAYTLGGLVAARRADRGEAWELLIRACESCGLMQEERSKTVATLKRAFRDGEKHPAERRSVLDYFSVVGDADAYIAGATGAPPAPVRTIEPFKSVAETWDGLTEQLKHAPAPISTGLDNLDRALDGGLRVGLTVLGATPACGKSALMLQVADYIAASHRPVLFYALEMTASELRTRSLLRASMGARYGLPSAEAMGRAQSQAMSKALRRVISGNSPDGFYTESEAVGRATYDYLSTSAGYLYIRDGRVGYDDGAPTVEGICEDVAAFCETHPGVAPVVIVDYLQLLRCRDKTADRSEYDRMNVASLALKRLSARGLPVVVISSFARSSYYTRPTLESFKGSGGIEYTASCAVVLGFREYLDAEVWAKGTGYNHYVADKYKGVNGESPARLEVRCVKARDFAPGSAELAFYGEFFRFEDVAKADEITEDLRAERYMRWSGDNGINAIKAKTKATKS